MVVDKNLIVPPNTLNKYTVDGNRILRRMPHSLFVKVLVQHFDIKFRKNAINWPRRKKK